MRLLSAAHQLEMDIDRKRPTMARMMTPIRKFKGDGPDTLYYEAKLDETLEYELHLRRGDDIFLCFTIYAHDERGAYKIVDGLSIMMSSSRTFSESRSPRSPSRSSPV